MALLRANRRSIWNSAWHRGGSRRWGTVMVLAGGGSAWLVAIALLDHFVGPSLSAAPSRLLTTVSGALVLLTGFTLVTSVSFAVASAYFAKDVDWLLTVPLSERGLLVHRMISQLALGVAVGTALLGPVLIAAGLHTGTLWLLPLEVLGLVALLAVPVAVGLLLVVVAVRLIPPTRVRDGTAALICLVGLGMAAVGISAHRSGAGLPWAGAINGLGSGWLHTAFLPPAWAARLLTSAWQGDGSGALVWSAVLLALSLATISVVLLISAPLHREGWVRAQLAPRRRTRGRVSWRPLPAVLALLRKDIRNLSRDPVQLSQLLLPLALFAIYLLAPQSIASSQVLLRNFPLWYGPLTTSLFAALFVASGLGLRAVGSEGRHFWCLRSAPLGVRDLLFGKLALPATAATGSALVLMWAAELRAQVPPAQMVFSAILLVLAVTGLAALATGLGAIWPRLDWSDPRRASGIWLSVVFLMLGSTFIGACLVALTVPLVIPQLGTVGSDLAAIGACALCAALAGVIPLRVGYLRLLRLEI